MAVVAALRTAAALTEDDVVVVLLPDHGRGYLDKLYDDAWLAEHGYAVPEQTVDPVVAEVRAFLESAGQHVSKT
jgi:cystathionine beta-synthase